MVEHPPGKASWSHDLYTKSDKIQHLNENFKRHLVRRDKVDNTSLALLWKTSDNIHGPQAPFPEACGPVKPLPFTCVAVATPETATEQAASPDVDATGAGTPPAATPARTPEAPTRKPLEQNNSTAAASNNGNVKRLCAILEPGQK